MNRDQDNELKDLGLSESERANMERMLAEFHREASERAERPELFWAAQRTRIAARIREAHTQRGLGWAATLAAVTAMVVFVSVPTKPPSVNPAPKTTVATKAPATDDETLLRSIDETTNSDVPDALAPTNILASEMNRGIDSASNRKTGRNVE